MNSTRETIILLLKHFQEYYDNRPLINELISIARDAFENKYLRECDCDDVSIITQIIDKYINKRSIVLLNAEDDELQHLANSLIFRARKCVLDLHKYDKSFNSNIVTISYSSDIERVASNG